MENKNCNKSGIGFCGALTIAFIVLKLCGVINWGWVWVLAPLWISWVLDLLIVGIAVVVKLLTNR